MITIPICGGVNHVCNQQQADAAHSAPGYEPPNYAEDHVIISQEGQEISLIQQSMSSDPNQTLKHRLFLLLTILLLEK